VKRRQTIEDEAKASGLMSRPRREGWDHYTAFE